MTAPGDDFWKGNGTTSGARLRLKACERCRGDMIRDFDDDNVCLQCGWRPDIGEEGKEDSRLERKTSRMLAASVGQLINQRPDVVQLTDSVQHAARLMKLHGISSIPVCDGDRLVGAITEHDIVVRCAADGISPASCRVDQCMRESPAAIPLDATLDDALRLMQEKSRRSVCVTDEGRLVGMITQRRLQKFLAFPEGKEPAKPASRVPPRRPAVNAGGSS